MFFLLTLAATPAFGGIQVKFVTATPDPINLCKPNKITTRMDYDPSVATGGGVGTGNGSYFPNRFFQVFPPGCTVTYDTVNTSAAAQANVTVHIYDRSSSSVSSGHNTGPITVSYTINAINTDYDIVLAVTAPCDFGNLLTITYPTTASSPTVVDQPDNITLDQNPVLTASPFPSPTPLQNPVSFLTTKPQMLIGNFNTGANAPYPHLGIPFWPAQGLVVGPNQSREYDISVPVGAVGGFTFLFTPQPELHLTSLTFAGYDGITPVTITAPTPTPVGNALQYVFTAGASGTLAPFPNHQMSVNQHLHVVETFDVVHCTLPCGSALVPEPGKTFYDLTWSCSEDPAVDHTCNHFPAVISALVQASTGPISANYTIENVADLVFCPLGASSDIRVNFSNSTYDTSLGAPGQPPIGNDFTPGSAKQRLRSVTYRFKAEDFAGVGGFPLNSIFLEGSTIQLLAGTVSVDNNGLIVTGDAAATGVGGLPTLAANDVLYWADGTLLGTVATPYGGGSLMLMPVPHTGAARQGAYGIKGPTASYPVSSLNVNNTIVNGTIYDVNNFYNYDFPTHTVTLNFDNLSTQPLGANGPLEDGFIPIGKYNVLREGATVSILYAAAQFHCESRPAAGTDPIYNPFYKQAGFPDGFAFGDLFQPTPEYLFFGDGTQLFHINHDDMCGCNHDDTPNGNLHNETAVTTRAVATVSNHPGAIDIFPYPGANPGDEIGTLDFSYISASYPFPPAPFSFDGLLNGTPYFKCTKITYRVALTVPRYSEESSPGVPESLYCLNGDVYYYPDPNNTALFYTYVPANDSRLGTLDGNGNPYLMIPTVVQTGPDDVYTFTDVPPGSTVSSGFMGFNGELTARVTLCGCDHAVPPHLGGDDYFTAKVQAICDTCDACAYTTAFLTVPFHHHCNALCDNPDASSSAQQATTDFSFRRSSFGAADANFVSGGNTILAGTPITATTAADAGVDLTLAYPCDTNTVHAAGRISPAAIVRTLVQAAVSTAGGGAGYAPGDILKVVGGTGSAATIQVLTTVGGAVASVAVLTVGSYTANPPVTQNAAMSVSGTGAGVRLDLTMSAGTTLPNVLAYRLSYTSPALPATYQFFDYVPNSGTLTLMNGSAGSPFTYTITLADLSTTFNVASAMHWDGNLGAAKTLFVNLLTPSLSQANQDFITEVQNGGTLTLDMRVRVKPMTGPPATDPTPGAYILSPIQGQFWANDTTGTPGPSCDPGEALMEVLDVQTFDDFQIRQADFADLYNYGWPFATGPCERRFTLETYTLGGLPQLDEFRHELRYLVKWQPGTDLPSLALPPDVTLNNAQFFLKGHPGQLGMFNNTVKFSPPSGIGTVTFDSFQLAGAGAAQLWPAQLFDRNGFSTDMVIRGSLLNACPPSTNNPEGCPMPALGHTITPLPMLHFPYLSDFYTTDPGCYVKHFPNAGDVISLPYPVANYAVSLAINPTPYLITSAPLSITGLEYAFFAWGGATLGSPWLRVTFPGMILPGTDNRLNTLPVGDDLIRGGVIRPAVFGGSLATPLTAVPIGSDDVWTGGANGSVTAGPDGILQTHPAGTDVIFGGMITAGCNGTLDTVLLTTSQDDVLYIPAPGNSVGSITVHGVSGGSPITYTMTHDLNGYFQLQDIPSGLGNAANMTLNDLVFNPCAIGQLIDAHIEYGFSCTGPPTTYPQAACTKQTYDFLVELAESTLAAAVCVPKTVAGTTCNSYVYQVRMDSTFLGSVLNPTIDVTVPTGFEITDAQYVVPILDFSGALQYSSGAVITTAKAPLKYYFPTYTSGLQTTRTPPFLPHLGAGLYTWNIAEAVYGGNKSGIPATGIRPYPDYVDLCFTVTGCGPDPFVFDPKGGNLCSQLLTVGSGAVVCDPNNNTLWQVGPPPPPFTLPYFPYSTTLAMPSIGPMVSCALNKTVQCPATAIANFDPPTVTPGCDLNPDISFHDDPVAGVICPVLSATKRTWTVKDHCGNPEVHCYQTIFVEDNVAPVITSVPTTLALGCNPLPVQLPSDVSVKLGSTAFDNNCGTLVIHVTHDPIVINGCARSQRFYVSASDACQTSPQTQVDYTWTVDTMPPVMTCPAPQTLPATVDCTYVMPDLTGLVATYDNCPGIGPVTQTPLIGSPLTAGTTYTVVFTVCDACGGPGHCVSCSTTLTVPGFVTTLNCPPDITTECENESGAWVTYTLPTATSDCCTPGLVTCVPPSPVHSSIGVTTIICTVPDSCGNITQCCFTITVEAQGVGQWQWAKQANGSLTNSGNAIAVDRKGNVFVTGSYQTDASGFTFAGTGVTLSSLGGHDIFLAKYNGAGVLQWAVRAGGSSDEAGNGVAVDAMGNPYVTGTIYGPDPATFYGTPQIILIPSGPSDIFVAKFDGNNGACLWAVQAGGTGADAGTGIAIAPNGNVLVTGAWVVSGAQEAFVLKLDALNGSTLGSGFSSGPAGHSAAGRAIAVDANNDAYVGGDYAGNQIAFSTGFNSITAPSFSTGLGRIFVVKFPSTASPTINAIWLKHSSHGNASCSHGATGIAVDSASGSVYFTGIFNGTADFGVVPPLVNTKNGVCLGQLYDYLILDLDAASGTPIWVVKGNGAAPSDDETRGIAVDPFGNPCVTGFLHPNSMSPYVNEGPTVLVASYDKVAGAHRWTHNAIDGPTTTVSPQDLGLGIAVDHAGCVHVTGDYTVNLLFQSPVPALLSFPHNGREMFVAKMCPKCACDGQNLVFNGSFEDPVIPNNGYQQLPNQNLPAVTGWIAKPAGSSIELWSGNYNNNHEGNMAAEDLNQHLEINSEIANETVCQTVTVTPGCPATFCFWYVGRAGYVDNAFQVDLIGSPLPPVILTPAAYVNQASWQEYCTNFVPSASTITIAFAGASNPNVAGGAHIDNVSLTQCCPPGPCVGPSIVTSPQSPVITSGPSPSNPVSFTVTATGSALLKYYWYRNNVVLNPLGGGMVGPCYTITVAGNTSTLTLTGVPPNCNSSVDNGYYFVSVQNDCCDCPVSSARAQVTYDPGLPHVYTNAGWRFLDDGSDQGSAWRVAGFNDSAWLDGVALFGQETPGIYDWPILTPMEVGTNHITYYFRTHFNWSGSNAGVALTASAYIDDGAVFYLNGIEAGRVRLTNGPVNFLTLAANQSAPGTLDVLQLSASNLVSGDNVLAVEVHQSSPNSSNVIFGMTLQGTLPHASDVDLAVSAAASPNPVPVGSNTTVTITVRNIGATPATSVRLTNTIPPSLTFLSATSSLGGCTFISDPISASAFGPLFELPTDAGAGTNTRPTSVVAVDLDGDGRLDLVSANSQAAFVSVFRNIGAPGGLGSSSFAPRLQIAALKALDVVAADFDGDGRPDLAFCNIATNGPMLFLLRNLSTGPGNISFAPPVTFIGTGGGYALAVGDFNRDGRPDLVLVNENRSSIYVVQNQTSGPGLGTNSFGTRTEWPVGLQPRCLAVGDLNGDGWPEIVVGHNGESTLATLNNRRTASLGTNSFDAAVIAPTPTIVSGVVIADLDGDGLNDVLITRDSVSAIAVADLDGDGRPDVLELNQLSGRITLIQNTSNVGSLSLAELPGSVLLTSNTPAALRLVLADLDRNGQPDLIGAGTPADSLAILPNTTLRELTCAFPSLAAGQTATVMLALNGPNVTTAYLNSILSSAQSDLNPSNNLAFTSISVVPTQLRLTIVRTGGTVTLSWPNGPWTLQEANDTLGPWTSSANQTSPVTLAPVGAKRFYRLFRP